MKKLTAIILILIALLCGCAKESAYQPIGVPHVTMTVDWEWLYGKLPAGQYRILKQAGTLVIGAEFRVE